MVLVDTSVWISHFKARNEKLVELLLNDAVLIIFPIVGEIACGSIKSRQSIIRDLTQLPKAITPTGSETITLIERLKLFNKGLSYIDCTLIGTCLLTKCPLWTQDKTLLKAAKKLSVTTLA